MKRFLLCLSVLLGSAAPGWAFYPMPADQPRVCQASLDGAALKLRYLRGTPPVAEEMTLEKEPGKPEVFKVIRRVSLEQTLMLSPTLVEAYTTDGKKVEGKDLPGLLSDKEMPVLACSEKPRVDVLKVAKKGTLLIIVPIHLDMQQYGGGVAVPAIPVPVEPPKKKE